MKSSSLTQVCDSNQYRQTDAQLLGSIYLLFVHPFTFSSGTSFSFLLVSEISQMLLLSETQIIENPVLPLLALQTPCPQSDSSLPQSPLSLSPLMKPNELPYWQNHIPCGQPSELESTPEPPDWWGERLWGRGMCRRGLRVCQCKRWNVRWHLPPPSRRSH